MIRENKMSKHLNIKAFGMEFSALFLVKTLLFAVANDF